MLGVMLLDLGLDVLVSITTGKDDTSVQRRWIYERSSKGINDIDRDGGLRWTGLRRVRNLAVEA